jgi:monothiol glutaredoxin
MEDAIRERIQGLVDAHPIVLFMKGSKHFPQCGFSAAVVEVLKRSGAEFQTVNVLEDPAVRQGIKDFASWPTIPQLYVRGELVGGCDIVKELFEAGELQAILDGASA